MDVSTTKKSYEEKLAKMKMEDDNRLKFLDIVLQKCKLHNGPLTKVDELNRLITDISDEKKLKSALRLDVQYRKSIFIKNAENRPELYKLNSLPLDQLVMNLTALLSDPS